MRFTRQRRALLLHFEKRLSDRLHRLQDAPERLGVPQVEGSVARLAWTAAWVTGAVAVVAAGLYAGKELRSRYKFNRRTPYDFYAHSGDRSDIEFGVGT